MGNYTRKAVRGAGIMFFMMAASNFLGYVFRMLIAQFGGATSLGLVYAVISLFGAFSLLMNMGLRSSLVKYIPEFTAKGEPEKIKGAIIIIGLATFLLSFLVCGIIMVYAEQVAALYWNNSAQNVDIGYAAFLIRVYGVGVLFSSIILVLRNCFNGFQEIKYFSSIDLVKSIISTALVIVFLLLGLREVAPLIGFTITYVVFLPAIYGIIFIKKVFPEFFRIKADLSKDLAKKLFGFGITATLMDVAGTISGNIDTIILTFFRGNYQAGLYNAAQPTTKLISVVGPAITAVVFPMSSELWVTGKKEQLSRGLTMLYKYLLIIIFPMALILFLFPETILGTLFGKEFGQAGAVLSILTVGYVFQSFTWANTSALSGIGKPKDAGTVALIGSLVLVILDFALVPSYGMLGVGYANLTAFITTFLLSTMRIKAYVPVHIPWKDFFSVGTAGILIIGMSYLLSNVLSIWPRIFATVILGSVIYLLVLFLTRSLVFDDVKQIIHKVK